MTEVAESFTASLREVGVSVTRTNPEMAQDRVEEVVTQPCVGVELDDPFSEMPVSLSETAVDVDPTPAALRAATTGVTGAQFGVAEYGSLSLQMTDRASELVSLFVHEHVVLLRDSDVFETMEAAVDALDEEFARTRGSTILATGPSATADMGALVKGAHGPESVHVIVVEEEA